MAWYQRTSLLAAATVVVVTLGDGYSSLVHAYTAAATTTTTAAAIATTYRATFTAVPPSAGSPNSRQNKAFFRELQETLSIQDATPYAGRVRFSTDLDADADIQTTTMTPPLDTWSSLLTSGVRSIRVVALDGNVTTAATLPTNTTADSSSSLTSSDPTTIDLLAAEIVDRANWSEALDVWKQFGNTIPSPFQDLEFHVTCKRLHDLETDPPFFPPNLATPLRHSFALQLHNRTGWIPQPKRAQANIEINVVLHQQTVTVELVALAPPQGTHRLDHLPKPGFRRVESWAISKCANIQKGDVVLDPMCGRGTFLVEAAVFWPQAQRYVGVDCDLEQLQDAKCNQIAAHLLRNDDDNTNMNPNTHDELRLDFLQGDARNLTMLETNSVDKIICCPPFGRQFGTIAENPQLYDDCLKEWSRVLKDDGSGKMVLVIDEMNYDSLLDSIYKTNNNCQVDRVRNLRLGKLNAAILIVSKGSRGSSSNSRTSNIQFVKAFEWEREGRSEFGSATDRGLWTVMRAKALPNLVPVNP